MRTLLLATAFAVVIGTPLQSQSTVGKDGASYTWTGTLRQGALLTVRSFNGPIDVRASSGDRAEVRIEKRSRNAELRDLEYSVTTASNGDVTICTVYRGRDLCDSDSGRRSYGGDGMWRELSAAITVLVPLGNPVKIATGNGAVSVDGAGADVQASTGNGRVRVANTAGAVRVSTGNGEVDVRDVRASVRVSTGNGDVRVSTAEGPVEASSGNGDIDVTMRSLTARDGMKFSTGSGDVRLTLPTAYNGELDASTGRGEISSDFDLKVNGRMNPRRIRATIGTGGPLLRLSTGNGRLELRKAN